MKEKREYIFDYWKVNDYLLITSLVLFGLEIYLLREKIIEPFILLISYTTLWWSITFGKRKKKEVKK